MNRRLDRRCQAARDLHCFVLLLVAKSKWESLQRTDQENVRHCSKCSEDVYFCESDEDSVSHAVNGDCIARFEPSDPSESITIGRPSIEKMKDDILNAHKVRRERAIDAALSLEKHEICEKCGYPKPLGLLGCEICRCG